VEFVLAPGAWADGHVLTPLNLDWPEGVPRYGEKSYNEDRDEDWRAEAAGIRWRPWRPQNSRRAWPTWVELGPKKTRKRVETTGRPLPSRWPPQIHTVTPHGCELKGVLFILAFAFQGVL
jgi:hypothetical protein